MDRRFTSLAEMRGTLPEPEPATPSATAAPIDPLDITDPQAFAQAVLE